MKFWIYLIALLQLSIFNKVSFAEDFTIVNYASNDNKNTLFEQLDNLSWIPDGPLSTKHVYIFAAPWCPYSQELFNTLRQYNSKIQFRWLMVGSKNSEANRQNQILSKSRDPLMLANLYNKQSISGTTDIGSDIAENANAITFHTIQDVANITQRTIPGYPTLVFYNGSNWEINSGFNNLPSILERVQDRSSTGQNTNPFITKVINDHIKQLPPKSAYTTKKIVSVFSFPSNSALKVETISKNVPLRMEKEIQLSDNSKWVYLQIYTDGGGWADRNDFL